MDEQIKLKLEQAQAALDEARGLLEDHADLPFIMNSIYYAFLYSVLALLAARNGTPVVQSDVRALFEREFVLPGIFDPKYITALHIAFDLRPSCSCDQPRMIAPGDIERLLPLASDFLQEVKQRLHDEPRS